MKKILTTIGATVFLLGCSTLTQEQNNPNVTKNIEGVWIINNADSPKHFSNGYYKVICSDQHRVIRIKDGVLQGIHGGYVSFDGQVMVEKPRFLKTGNGFLGKTFKFNVKPDGSSFLQTGIKGSGSFENLKQQWVKVGSANHNIEGVWMMNLNNGHVRIKMIVDNFWNWIVVDPKTNNVTAALGGSYDYDGKNYVETTHFKFGGTEKWELGRKWQVVAELKDGNLLFHGKNDGGNDFTENWVKYGATSILSQKQDAPAALEQNKQAADASFEQRMKQARKPYNFINVSYMDVKDGMEEEYLKVESAWKKIHEKLASEGKIISWGLAKARKNEFGYEYITWVILRSRGALDKLYDMKALKAWMGEDKMDDLMAKTMETRSITGGELLTLEDYTLVSLDPPNEVVDSKNFFFHWNFMTPTEGKAQDYVNTEKNAFQPMHQKKSELNPRFQWWNLQKQILSWGSVNKAPYRTVDFFRNDIAQPSDKELEKINAQMPAFPEGLTYQNVMKMREMKRVTFDVVHLIDRSMSAETKAWETLIGTWTAPSATQWEKGAYRRKTITPYTEVFELFDAEGKVINRQKKPLSIEVINGINYFTIYPPNNEASFPFKIVDGKWYENMRGMLSNNSEKPDQFLVYKKTDQPVFSDKSSFTKKGEDVELVKAIIENYAAGKIDDYLALFTKDAKVTHNNNEPITISELAKIHRVHHEQIAGPVKILSSNYEVVATANGNKYGHAWVKFENTYKNGSKAVTPVFVSFGINNKGKVYFEHALYDTATVPDDSVYSEN